MNYREGGDPSGVGVEESASQVRPEIPEFMREAVAETQEIIRTIEACRREDGVLNQMLRRFVNDRDHWKANTRETLSSIDDARTAIQQQANGLIQEARQQLKSYPQAVEYLTGPADVLRELAPRDSR